MMKRLTPIARRLRQDSTDAELRLWSRLRSRQLEGAKFVRQFPIGRYVADFACRSAHLIVELDGGQHGPAVDATRTRELEAFGYQVVRFWDHDVLEDTDAVLEAIRAELLLGFGRRE
ncbi:DUF559 domain-containing protein [Sphingomonas ginkgonis]|uniref:DUF559 domain-containing protein n=1 Tax=Sphingomonas ginkgonis TaxID=2315330 RepID=A0A429VAI7_9SPHN|nr:DUF559 domain-containing protein [Sphingomonas ginkgonis]RST31010.1 DUF559 domain-containing protein [Sphingomonas ginkgonis]